MVLLALSKLPPEQLKTARPAPLLLVGVLIEVGVWLLSTVVHALNGASSAMKFFFARFRFRFFSSSFVTSFSSMHEGMYRTSVCVHTYVCV